MIGGDSNGVPFHDWCFEEWRAKYSIKPVWLKKDYTALASVLRAVPEEEARAAWRAYLASTDRFYEAHPPSKFFPSIDRWRVRVVPKAPKSGITDEEAAVLRERHYARVEAARKDSA